MRRLLVRPLAKDDLDEQARYIAQDNVDAALRLLDAAEGSPDPAQPESSAGFGPSHVRTNG
jgi:plasmid stabilization system protein ParE